MAQYPDEFLDRLELIWGRGFLSPGGAEEVAEIVRGLDLSGRAVLDIGSGAGGPALTLARDHGARVTGVDVEPQICARARRLAAAAGLADRIDIRLVAPGPLPFAEGAFDLVFSKDSLIHIPDKPALFAEALRMLRPGAVFAASDWLAGPGAADDPALKAYIAHGHLDFALATADEMAAAMRAAGFADVETRDRNEWYAPRAAAEAAAIEGPLRDRIVAVSSPEIHATWLKARTALAAAVASGGLRPTHLRGRRPES